MNDNRKNSFDEPAKVIKRSDAPEATVYALTFREAFINFFRTHFSKERFAGTVADNIPRKGDSKKEIIRKSVRSVSFVLLILGLAYMVFYYHGYRERIELLQNWETSIDSIDTDKLFDFEIEQLWKNIREQYPDVDFPEGMNLKFASLYAVNQDTAGVLRIPEKQFFSILMLNKTSPSYYLWKDMYGEYNRYGNPYIDSRCNIEPGKLSKNTIVYGHNTHDKLGFNKLTEYMTVDGYRQAPVVTLETLYEKTQWKIFAVMLTNSTSAADRGHLFRYLVTDFSSDGEFMTMIEGIYQRSMINTGIDVNADDKILTLYTCYQDIFDGGRLVVFARLLRDGESAEVDVTKSSFNHSARYPQAYYDQLNLKNPYEKLTDPIIYVTDENGSYIVAETDSPFADDTTASPAATDEPSSSQTEEGSTGAVQETSPAVTETTAPAPEENTTAAPSQEAPVPEQTTAASAPAPAPTEPAPSQAAPAA